MAPALGKRPRSAGVRGSGETCVHGVGWGGYNCRECPGKGICEHGRRRYGCKECGGSGICEHGRERYYCKECGGAGICEHGRRRSQCKECRAARASSARVIRPPFRLKPEAKKVEPEIKREPSDTSDPGVDPDAEVAWNVKPEPSDAPDPGRIEP